MVVSWGTAESAYHAASDNQYHPYVKDFCAVRRFRRRLFLVSESNGTFTIRLLDPQSPFQVAGPHYTPLVDAMVKEVVLRGSDALTRVSAPLFFGFTHSHVCARRTLLQYYRRRHLRQLANHSKDQEGDTAG